MPSFSHRGVPVSLTHALVVSRRSVLRGAPGGVGQVQVEPRLLAVLHLVDDVLAVGRPVDVDDQVLGRAVLRTCRPTARRRPPARTTPSFTVGFGSPAFG